MYLYTLVYELCVLMCTFERVFIFVCICMLAIIDKSIDYV